MFRSLKRLLVFIGLLAANVGCVNSATVNFLVTNNTAGTVVWLEVAQEDGTVDTIFPNGSAGLAWLGFPTEGVGVTVMTHAGGGHMSAGKIGARHGMHEKTIKLASAHYLVSDADVLNCTYDFATGKLSPPSDAAAQKAGAGVVAEKQSVSQGLQLLLDFVTANISTEEDIEPFFNQLDTDGDGSLSVHEVKAANKANNLGIKAKNVKKGIAYVDDTYGDGNGGLELQELIDAYVDIIVLGGGG